jgi:hypothetical protein
VWRDDENIGFEPFISWWIVGRLRIGNLRKRYH